MVLRTVICGRAGWRPLQVIKCGRAEIFIVRQIYVYIYYAKQKFVARLPAERQQESGFAAACGAAFDYAIAVPAGQIGGRLDFFII